MGSTGTSSSAEEQRGRRRTRLPAVVVLAAALVYLTAGLGGELEPAVNAPLVALQSVLVVGQALALLVRRGRPVTSAAVVVVLHGALLATSGAQLGIGSLAVMISVFHLVRRAPRRRAYLAVGTLGVLSSGTALFAALGAGQDLAAAAGVTALRLVVEFVAPALVAEFASSRDQLAGAAREREAFVQREHGYLVEQERSTERNALARELHDIAGHHLSGIIVSAQAAGALMDSDPERSRSMLRELEQEARATLVDLRGTVGLLRSDRDGADDGGRTPVANPGPADLPALVETASRRGQRVDHVETGESFRLGPIAGTSVYRMVQESLANAARHAPGAPCTVTVEYGREEMMISVENGPVEQRDPAENASAPDRRGYGLTGMNERAEMIGAELTTGASADGGWRNTLRVPRPTARTAR